MRLLLLLAMFVMRANSVSCYNYYGVAYLGKDEGLKNTFDFKENNYSDLGFQCVASGSATESTCSQVKNENPVMGAYYMTMHDVPKFKKACEAAGCEFKQNPQNMGKVDCSSFYEKNNEPTYGCIYGVINAGLKSVQVTGVSEGGYVWNDIGQDYALAAGTCASTMFSEHGHSYLAKGAPNYEEFKTKAWWGEKQLKEKLAGKPCMEIDQKVGEATRKLTLCYCEGDGCNAPPDDMAGWDDVRAGKFNVPTKASPASAVRASGALMILLLLALLR